MMFAFPFRSCARSVFIPNFWTRKFRWSKRTTSTTAGMLAPSTVRIKIIRFIRNRSQSSAVKHNGPLPGIGKLKLQQAKVARLPIRLFESIGARFVLFVRYVTVTWFQFAMQAESLEIPHGNQVISVTRSDAYFTFQPLKRLHRYGRQKSTFDSRTIFVGYRKINFQSTSSTGSANCRCTSRKIVFALHSLHVIFFPFARCSVYNTRSPLP